jgi:DNA-binding XRE family transcriptional regulator
MSKTTDSGIIPSFTQGDRLRKARELTGLSIADFADLLGVSARTVGNAELDRVKVRTITLQAWSRTTGVPVEWLQHGGPSNPAPGGGAISRRPIGLTRRYPCNVRVVQGHKRFVSRPVIPCPAAA